MGIPISRKTPFILKSGPDQSMGLDSFVSMLQLLHGCSLMCDVHMEIT